ncbi:MAG TPA: hypothetical protein VFB66_17390, partial [Tepidisphaeraceae bacterium]|nr:hypothetical protein [Tepidisphaeraceae bacterium]
MKPLLPTILTRAAESLEARLDILRVPTRKVKLSEWERLKPSVRDAVPRWHRKLLASHRLAGAVLEYRDRMYPFVRVLSLCDPKLIDFVLTVESPTN